MTAENVLSSPESDVYVGPRPFRTGQKLYGRDRESRQIVSLLISQRLVLLHAPSGAGKTSLINAKVVPALQKRRFEIPMHESAAELDPQPVVIRVNRGREAGDPPEANRYVLSALLSLELHRPPEERRSADELGTLTIEQYIEEAFPGASLEPGEESAGGETFRPLLLLLDQFEELITLDPTDREAKLAFLHQLGAALENEGRWALFSIREDFLGALEPFLPMIPTGLAATYHLDHLKAEIAAEAIKQPAAEAGVTYEEGVVEILIEDLRQVRVQGAGGDFQMKAGPAVEPVHLQVVCQSLWQVKGNAREIRQEHLDQLSHGKGTGVDQVLASYYAGRVRYAAREDGVTERRIRDWFGKQLIGIQKVRRPILLNEAMDFGMTTECLDVLDKAFLIRRENRSGAEWYELAHDRLMDPIISDNETWRSENLSSFQVQAELWNDRGRPEYLLLTRDSLAEAQIEADREDASQDETEGEFLAESERVYERALAAVNHERQKKRNRILAVAVTVLSALTFWAIYQTINAKRHASLAEEASENAETEEEKAQWAAYSGLTAQAQDAWQDGYLRLGLNHLKRCKPKYDHNLGWEHDYIKTAFSKDKHTFFGHKASVSTLAFSPDGMLFASGGVDMSIRIWGVNANGEHQIIELTDAGWINDLTFSPDGTRIVCVGDDHEVRIFDTATCRKIQSFPAHDDRITGVSYEPLGAWIVTASIDKDLGIWDPESGRAIKTLKGHTLPVRCVAVSPVGEWLVSGSEDKTLRIWNPETGLTTKTLIGHEGPVTCVAISSDGKWILSGADDGFKIWNAATGNEIPLVGESRVIKAMKTPVTAVAFHPSEIPLFSVGGIDGRARIISWDEAGGTFRITGAVWDSIQIHTGKVTSIAFRPLMPWNRRAGFIDQWAMVSGGVDCLVRYLDASPEPTMPTLEGHNGTIWRASFNNTGKRLASGDAGGAIQIWSQRPRKIIVETGRSVEETVRFPGSVWDSWPLKLIFADNENQLPSDGNSEIFIGRVGSRLHFRIFDESGIRVVDTNESKFTDETAALPLLKATLDGLWGRPEKDVQQQREKILDFMTALVGYWRADWQLEEGQGIKAHDGAAWGLDWSPDGKWIASGGTDGFVRVWDANTRENIRSLKGNDGEVVNVAFSPDQKWLACSGKDSFVRIWEAAPDGSDTARILKGHEGWTSGIAFSPDSKQLISGSADKTVKVWDVESGELIKTLTGHTDVVHCLAYAYDGRTFASGSNDMRIFLWDAETFEIRNILEGHAAWVTWVDFHPDGKRLASGSQDNTIKLWELEHGQDVLTIKKHLDSVWSVRFSPDGKRLTSASADQTIKIWEATDVEAVKTANPITHKEK